MESGWLDALLQWIQQHPNWAGALIFLSAFLETLAIVGLLMPGALILFGFGTLVGLDALSLQTAWLWCSAGAIAGDGVSFWLGAHYQERLRNMWLFRRYGRMITRGERYFQRHGMKSVFVGRFVGPVRPVIPMTAGMLGMSWRRYLPTNVLASLLWAPFYLLPGVLFGASIEVAASITGRLAVLIGIAVLTGWVLVTIISTIYDFWAPAGSRLLARWLKWTRRHPLGRKLTAGLVDPHAPESGSLMLLAVLLALAAWGFASLMISLPLIDGRPGWDLATARFMATMRNPWTDPLMATLMGLGSTTALLGAAAVVALWLAWRRRFLALAHWGAAAMVGLALSLILGYTLVPDAPAAKLLPGRTAALSVALLGCFAVLIARELPNRRRGWPYVASASLAALIALTHLYFQTTALSHWLAGACLGLIWAFALGLAYRRHKRRSFWAAPPAAFFYGSLLAIGLGTGALWQERTLDRVAPAPTGAPLRADRWVERGWRSLPQARVALRPSARLPLNLQYAGGLSPLAKALSEAGWTAPPVANSATVLKLLSAKLPPHQIPVLPAGVDGAAEALILTPADDRRTERPILRLWPTGRSLRGRSEKPLWVGQVVEQEVASRWALVRWWRDRNPSPQGLEQIADALGDQAEVFRPSGGPMLLELIAPESVAASASAPSGAVPDP